MSAWGDLAMFHFLRPWWLCAALLLPALVWWSHRRRRAGSVWQSVVDPHLLPRLLEVREDRRGRLGVVVASLAYLLAVFALAGPSWRQSAQPLWQSQAPLVVALDLSSASLSSDLPPSRLAQARAKLAVLLQQRRGGQTGLVAFAGDAFTVAPLTDDAANVALFLDALQPDVMPRDGQRADAAIAWSAQLLQRAGATQGDILVLTDHADSNARKAATEAVANGYRVSVLGLGTDAGAAYRHSSGAITRARLDATSLRQLAASGRGRYAAMTSDEADLRRLGVLEADGAEIGDSKSGRIWRDEGYWLLPPLMLLALFAFRRRSAGAFLLVLVCAMPLREAQAADLWRRPDQARYVQLQRGNQAYRQGDFKKAAQEYAGVDSATAHYNRGNALAKAGEYPQAIGAYDEALRREPRMADALANKRAVEAAMKRQQQGGGKGAGQKSQGGQSNPQSSPSQSNQAANSNPQTQSSSSAPQKQQANPPQQQSQRSQTQASPAKPQDAQAQQEADRAQRERMQRALQQAKQRQGQPSQEGQARRNETPEQRERRLANEAWLRRVPDDPGGLLRAKFRLEYERRVSQDRTEE